MVEYGYSKSEICRKVGCTYGTLMKHLVRAELSVLVAPRHQVRPSWERATVDASEKPVYRRSKKRKIVILSDSDRAIHIERLAAAWKYNREMQRDKTVPRPAILQESASKCRVASYHHMLFEHEKSIVRMLKKGHSKTYIAKYLGCNIKTLNTHLLRMGVKIIWE